MLKNLPKSQQRAAVILGLVIIFVFMVLIALQDISLFFVLLVLLILGVCWLRMKKPEFFQVFAKKKPAEETRSEGADQNKDVFSAHIILLYQGGMTVQQIMVDQAEFTIGRDPSCNFVLAGNTDISRRHAIIRYDIERGYSTITDNHSTHGTKVNGNYLNPGEARKLHNGDLIQIEDRVLTVQNKNY